MHALGESPHTRLERTAVEAWYLAGGMVCTILGAAAFFVGRFWRWRDSRRGTSSARALEKYYVLDSSPVRRSLGAFPLGRSVDRTVHPVRLVRQLFLLAPFFCLASACAGPRPEALDDAHRRALLDTVSTIFDSLAAVHRDHPDTGVLRRLHPPGDTIQFVEGALIESFTGDSLFRRVRALHVPVRAMSQRFSDRSGYLLDANHAVLTALESVDWVDTTGTHQYSGHLTITVSRRGPRWVIRTYRGS